MGKVVVLLEILNKQGVGLEVMEIHSLLGLERKYSSEEFLDLTIAVVC